MPAYNAEKTVEASINSVKAQTYSNWELIILDDASQDTTLQIVKSAAQGDARIHVVINEHNMGVAATRNAGIAQAKGQWIAFLDSDDLWREDKLEKQLRFAKENDAAITYTATSYMDSSGNIFNYVLPAEFKFTYKVLMHRNIMSCSSVIVMRDVMMPFPQGFIHEDYAVWLQIVRKTECAYGLDEPLLIYRMGEATRSSGRLKSAQMIWGTYREVGYGRVSATFYTLRYAMHSIVKRARIQSGCRQ